MRHRARHRHWPADGTEVYAEDPRGKAPSILRARCSSCRKPIVFVQAERDRQAYWRLGAREGSTAPA